MNDYMLFESQMTLSRHSLLENENVIVVL